MNCKLSTILIILIFLGCTNKQDDQELIEDTIENIEIDLSCSIKELENQSSRLNQITQELYSLQNRYKETESGEMKIEDSQLIIGLKRLINSMNRIDESLNIVLKENFGSTITKRNYLKVKGERDLSKKLFARAKIEEYIFTSKLCAKTFFDNINQFVENESDWLEINKSPNSIYREENRIYFVVSGGWYMKPFYTEIVDQIKSNSDKLETCNISELVFVKNRVEHHPGKVGIKDAEILLRNSTNECISSNAEYSQFYNEVLFDIALMQPKSIQELLRNENLINRNKEMLLKFLEKPIHDNINIDEILSKLRNLEEGQWKEKMINSIKKSI